MIKLPMWHTPIFRVRGGMSRFPQQPRQKAQEPQQRHTYNAKGYGHGITLSEWYLRHSLPTYRH